MSPRSRSWSLPLLVTTLLGGVVVWQISTAHMARGILVPVIALAWAVFMALWLAAAPRPGKWRRVTMVFTLVALLGIAALALLRYDGSADGTARPQFRWRWQDEQARSRDLPSALSAEGEADMPAGAAPWPRFMGLNGDGVAPTPDWSTDWASQPPRQVWRIPVGEGWGGFAVGEGRALTLEQRGEKECVACYRLSDGALMWLHEEAQRFEEGMGGPGPRSTPTLDLESKTVLALGANGALNALDLVTGKPRWRRDVLKDGKGSNLMYAKASSPLLTGDKVIVSGGKGGASLCAYRLADGELLWKAGNDSSAYSSPVLRSLAGQDQIVSVNQTTVTGHDPADGQVLWSFDWPGGLPKVGQPVPAGTDRLLVTAGYGMKSHLIEIKPAANGRCTVRAVWSSSVPRTKFSSASIVGDHFYAIDEGTLVCGSLSDGERVWRAGRYGYGQHLLCGRDLLLLQSEPGDVVLVRADPSGLQEMARLTALDSKTWNPPTLAGRWLLVRNDREAICFELPAANANSAEDRR